MGNSSDISVYIFFTDVVNLDVAAGRFVGMCTKQLGTKAALVSKPVCIQRKKQKGKKQWDEDHKRISVARDVHESWKKIKCVFVCVFLGLGLRSTSFVTSVLSF